MLLRLLLVACILQHYGHSLSAGSKHAGGRARRRVRAGAGAPPDGPGWFTGGASGQGSSSSFTTPYVPEYPPARMLAQQSPAVNASSDGALFFAHYLDRPVRSEAVAHNRRRRARRRRAAAQRQAAEGLAATDSDAVADSSPEPQQEQEESPEVKPGAAKAEKKQAGTSGAAVRGAGGKRQPPLFSPHEPAAPPAKVCPPGYGTDVQGEQCIQCLEGWVSIGGPLGKAFCSPCPQLTRSNADRSACVTAIVTPDVNNALCDRCPDPTQAGQTVCCGKPQACCGRFGCCDRDRCVNNATTGFTPFCCATNCSDTRVIVTNLGVSLTTTLRCCTQAERCINVTAGSASTQKCCLLAERLCVSTSSASTFNCCPFTRQCSSEAECCAPGVPVCLKDTTSTIATRCCAPPLLCVPTLFANNVSRLVCK